MLSEYDSVVLVQPLNNEQVPLHSKGVILMVYTDPWLAYEVEFFDDSGESIGNFTVEDGDVKKLGNN
jgi:hypothetical protein